MLFSARELASRLSSDLTMSFGAVGALQPDSTLSSDWHEAIDRAMEGLSRATMVINELQRLIGTT